MFRIKTVAVAIPAIFAAWAGPHLAVAAQKPPDQVTLQKPLDPVTLSGCIARQTGAGTANTPSERGVPAGQLLLTRIVTPTRDPSRSAVPGGTPGAGDTGTIGTRASQANATAAGLEQSYELTGARLVELGEQVGQRVEITGTVVALTSAGPDTAHPSAPRGQLTVTSFRALGGACPLS